MSQASQQLRGVVPQPGFRGHPMFTGQTETLPPATRWHTAPTCTVPGQCFIQIILLQVCLHFFRISFTFAVCVAVQVWMSEDRQPSRVKATLQPCGSQRLNSDLQAWWPVEPGWPFLFSFYSNFTAILTYLISFNFLKKVLVF